MEKPSLNNQDEFPDDGVLSRHLGNAKPAWDAFIDLLKEYDPPITGEWRFYKDGHNWLFKVTRKKKTVCWVSVWEKLFKTTLYFSDKFEELILNSKLNKKLIDQFVNGKRYGKIRGITVELKKPADLKQTRLLIEIKGMIK